MSFGDVRGKNIILFDDIYTTGKSFLIVASKISQLGASQLRGLFLGKTHWLNDDGSVNMGVGFVSVCSNVTVDDSDYQESEKEVDDYENDSDIENESGRRYYDDIWEDPLYALLGGEMDAYWNID
jgi:hypoxanthine phosphoribosyltransferase